MTKQWAVMVFKCYILIYHSEEIQHKQDVLKPITLDFLSETCRDKGFGTGNLFSDNHILCGSLTPPFVIWFPTLSRGQSVRQP